MPGPGGSTVASTEAALPELPGDGPHPEALGTRRVEPASRMPGPTVARGRQHPQVQDGGLGGCRQSRGAPEPAGPSHALFLSALPPRTQFTRVGGQAGGRREKARHRV